MRYEQPSQTPSWCLPLTETRLWLVVLWATLLGLAAAGWWASEQWFAQQARQTSMMLLPSGPVLESQRAALLKELQAAAPAGQLRWVEPSTLHERLRSEMDDASRRALLPGDASWLPWTVELHPALPLDSLGRLQAFAAQAVQDGRWAVYWDQQPLRQLILAREAARMTLGCLALATLLLGGVALWLLPGSQAPWASLGWSLLLSLTAILGLWTAITAALQFVPPVTALGAGLAAGIILAGPLAAVIRKKSPKKRVALSIDEDIHERAR